MNRFDQQAASLDTDVRKTRSAAVADELRRHIVGRGYEQVYSEVDMESYKKINANIIDVPHSTSDEVCGKIKQIIFQGGL